MLFKFKFKFKFKEYTGKQNFISFNQSRHLNKCKKKKKKKICNYNQDPRIETVLIVIRTTIIILLKRPSSRRYCKLSIRKSYSTTHNSLELKALGTQLLGFNHHLGGKIY